MIQHTINTSLVGKDELFRVLALGEALGLPVLLIGVPGVAKTQAAIDYAAGRPTFISQLSIGTKPHELRGYIDMNALVADKQYKTISPIVDAEVIVIDEVDKAYGEIKNTLLSVMREHKLFLGSEGTKDCKWKSFVGCCNTVPKDLHNNPFWDRFIIRYTVERLPSDEIGMIWSHTAPKSMVLDLPNGELQNINKEAVSHSGVLAGILYSESTDRTLSSLPRMIQAANTVWSFADYKLAAMKIASFINPSKITEVQKALTPPEVAEIENAIGFLQNIDTPKELAEHYMACVAQIRKAIQDLGKKDKYLREAKESRDANPAFIAMQKMMEKGDQLDNTVAADTGKA